MEFPGVKALDNVSFTLMPGECHVLVGENGAGKSTLSKCITGENRMTSGELYVKGEKINLANYGVRESQARGIAIVHQEFTLMDDMTGTENLFVGRYEKKGIFVDWKKLDKRAAEIMEDISGMFGRLPNSSSRKLTRTGREQLSYCCAVAMSCS